MRRLLLLGLLGTVALAGDVGAAEPRSFDDCAERVAETPEDLEAYRCYWMLSRRRGEPRQALAALDSLAAERGEGPRIDLYRGAILADLGDPASAARLEAASAGCEEVEEWTCVVYARLALAWQRRRDPELAWRELDRARDASERGFDPFLKARVYLGRGQRAITDRDFAAARAELAIAAEELLPSGPFDARFGLLSAQGSVAFATERLDQAIERYREAEAAALEAGDPFARALASYNALLVERHLEIRGLGPPVGLDRLEEVLEAALAARNPGTEVAIRLQIAQAAVSRERREAELDRVIAAGSLEHAVLALLVRRNRLAEEGDAGGARRAMARAAELVERSHDPDLALRLCFRGTLLASLEGLSEAERGAALRCLDQLDDLLARQPLALDQWGLSWRYQLGLYTFADRLVRQGDVELALEAFERLRTRSVIAGLAAGGSSDELGAVRADIASLQARLYRHADERTERAELIRRLEALEAREIQLVRQLGAVPLRLPPPPSIDELQAALDEGSAILSFQTVPWQGREGETRSWVAVIDRRGVRTHPLPPTEELAAAVRSFNGLLGRRDRVLRHAAEALFEQLLGAAFAELPEAVGRLIVVPDGPVHELPLAALREPGAGRWLGERFEIVRAPSLSAWLASRQSPGTALAPRAFAVVDPALGDPAPLTPSPTRVGSFEISGLGRLPAARREAESLRAIYRDAVVLVGDAATEAALKRADLEGVGLLHLAAHAVVDPQRPHRSAILLAPEGADDGLLQMRDVAALRLDGAIVVLAACRSADGSQPGGPGVFSLARAFLDGGARAVVANLQRIGDADSHRLLRTLFEELGRGREVADALARARRRLSRDQPAEAWATTVLLGDAEARLEVTEGPGGALRPAVAVLLAIALLLVSRWAVRRFRP